MRRIGYYRERICELWTSLRQENDAFELVRLLGELGNQFPVLVEEVMFESERKVKEELG